MTNQQKLVALYALYILVAIASGYVWYTDYPEMAVAGRFYLTYLFVPALLVTFLALIVPQILQGIVIVAVLGLNFWAGIMIYTHNQAYEGYAWAVFAFEFFMLLSGMLQWNNKKKAENENYSTVAGWVAILVIATLVVFISTGSWEWSLVFSIGFSFLVFLISIGLKAARGAAVGAKH